MTWRKDRERTIHASGVSNKPILFLFQVQVLKLLLNLSENPAMTEGLLGAQVNSLHVCFVNMQMCRCGQMDLDGFIPFIMLTGIISEEQYCVVFSLWFFLPI